MPHRNEVGDCGAPAIPNSESSLQFMRTSFAAELPIFDVVTHVEKRVVLRFNPKGGEVPDLHNFEISFQFAAVREFGLYK